MQYRSVGRSGLKVSTLSLGGWLTADQQLNREHFQRLISIGIDYGINYIDLADLYAQGQAESLCGTLLQQLDRHELVIASKCFWPMSTGVNNRGLSRKHIMESVHATLKRLNTDYLDLFFAHRFDPETPLDETLRAIEDLIRQGKILYWGTCGWTTQQLRHIYTLSREYKAYAPIAQQAMYNLHERGIELELIPLAKQLGMGLMTWSPLASGVLSGKYHANNISHLHSSRRKWMQPWLESNLQKQTQQLVDIAHDLGVKPAQLALAWVLKNPQVSSIISAVSTVEQLQENVQAMELEFDDELWQILSEIFVGY